ncbi:MAG: hypothetical protein AAB966_03310 [Patescibacteria group bacterium]
MNINLDNWDGSFGSGGSDLSQMFMRNSREKLKYIPDVDEVRVIGDLAFLENSRNLEKAKIAKGSIFVIGEMRKRLENGNIEKEVREGLQIVLKSFNNSLADWLNNEKNEEIVWNFPEVLESVSDNVSKLVVEQVEFSMFDNYLFSELNKKRKVSMLDNYRRPVIQETKIPGFFLVESMGTGDKKNDLTKRYVANSELPMVDEKMTIRQEFVAKMGTEPVVGNQVNGKQENVHEHEKSFLRMKPKSKEFDLSMRDYFLLLSDQLWMLLGENEKGKVTYPYRIYDGEVNSLDELREKIIAIAIGERKAVLARGRADSGQVGDYFWDASEVEDLGDIKKQLDVLISLSVKHFGVDSEEYFRKTTGLR